MAHVVLMLTNLSSVCWRPVVFFIKKIEGHGWGMSNITEFVSDISSKSCQQWFGLVAQWTCFMLCYAFFSTASVCTEMQRRFLPASTSSFRNTLTSPCCWMATSLTSVSMSLSPRATHCESFSSMTGWCGWPQRSTWPLRRTTLWVKRQSPASLLWHAFFGVCVCRGVLGGGGGGGVGVLVLFLSLSFCCWS